jgi:hypothetical protein
MDTVLVQTVLLALSAIFTLVTAYLKRKMGKRAEAQEEAAKKVQQQTMAMELGIQSLLRLSIMQLHDKCRTNGRKRTYHEAQAMERMYEAYHNLGGNGMATEIFEDFKTFELVPNK